MALPTGSGSEILKSVAGSIANSTSGTVVLTALTLHIISILSIVLTNESGSVGSQFRLAANDGTDRYLVRLVNPLAAYETFVFNEKIVLNPGNTLKIWEHNNQQLDYWISYIDQDWTTP